MVKDDKLSLVPNDQFESADINPYQPPITRVVIISQSGVEALATSSETDRKSSCMVTLYAVLTCIFCCLPLGIVAIVFASKYRRALKVPELGEEAQRYHRLSVHFSTLSLVFGIIIIIAYVCRLMLYTH